jgi:hypothetical protein
MKHAATAKGLADTRAGWGTMLTLNIRMLACVEKDGPM